MPKKSEPNPDFRPITAEPAQLAATTLKTAREKVELSEIHALQDQRRDGMSRADAQAEIVIAGIVSGGEAPVAHATFQDAIAQARLAQKEADAAQARAREFQFAALSIQQQWDAMIEDYLRKKEVDEFSAATLRIERDELSVLESALRRNLGEAFAHPSARVLASSLAVKKHSVELLQPLVAEKHAEFLQARLELRIYAQKNGIPDSVFESAEAPENADAAA